MHKFQRKGKIRRKCVYLHASTVSAKRSVMKHFGYMSVPSDYPMILVQLHSGNIPVSIKLFISKTCHKLYQQKSCIIYSHMSVGLYRLTCSLNAADENFSFLTINWVPRGHEANLALIFFFILLPTQQT